MHDLQKEKNLSDLENESIYSVGVEINSTITYGLRLSLDA